jgi:hypothetical protein
LHMLSSQVTPPTFNSLVKGACTFYVCVAIFSISSKPLLQFFYQNIFCPKITSDNTSGTPIFFQTLGKVPRYDTWIVICVVNIQPHNFSGESTYTTMNAESVRFQFVISIYMPNKIWPRHIVGPSVEPSGSAMLNTCKKFNTLFSADKRSELNQSLVILMWRLF